MNKPQQFKKETQIGSVESDSGNHLVDVVQIINGRCSIWGELLDGNN